MKNIIKSFFNFFRSEQWRAIEKMIDKIVMATTPIFLIVAYLTIAFGSSFKLKNYPNFFVYVSFFMSLLLLVISIIPYLKHFTQRYRGTSMVVVLGLSFCYASLRVAYMPFMPQIEDMGTGLLLLISFCMLLNERNGKDNIMKNKREIDVLQIVTDRNKNRIRKPLPIVYNYILALVFIAILYLIMQVPDAFTVNQATILGIAGSTVISIYVLFLTLDREKRNRYLDARKNAKVLSQMLESVYAQFERIKNGMIYPVVYTSSWIDNYQKCALYLEYDYLEYLLREFEIVEKINKAIENGMDSQVQELLEFRRQTITDWTLDFDILKVKSNLNAFAEGREEDRPWKQEKRYQEFKMFFVANYTDKVKLLTKKYLQEHNGQCGVRNAQYFVMKEIRKEAALQSGEYKYIAIENKIMLNAIFAVYLSLKKDDDFSLCWGELTLNKTN